MRVLLDLNVLLDVLQNRAPHVQASARVLDLAVRRSFEAGLSAHAVTTMHYLMARHAGAKRADETVDWVLSRLRVWSVTEQDLRKARALGLPDFEDAVVTALAVQHRADFIVTRNVSDFRGSPVTVLTPEELLAHQRQEN